MVESLYITPSTASQSLQRLRAQLNDPLLIHSGKGITPTTTGLNLHHRFEKDLRGLEQTINIANKFELGKSFTTYSPQLISCTSNNMLIRCLRQGISIDIECHGILLSAENTEGLLVQCKADLATTLQPVTNHFVIYMPLHITRNSLMYSNKHPRVTDASSYEQITAEEFTLLTFESAGVDEIQTDIDERFMNRKVSFRNSSLMTTISSISVADLLGIVPTELYGLHHDFLKLKEIKLEQPLPAVKLYISYNRTLLNNPVFSRFIDRLNDGSRSITTDK